MGDIPDPISWIIIGVFVLLHFFFSASETALSCCNRFKMQVKADDGNKSAKLVIKALDKFDRALTAVLIGNNIAAISASAISTFLFLKMFQSTGMTDFVVSLISSISLSLVIYAVGDALPKTIARAIPDTISTIVIYPIYGILWFLTYIIPITLLFELLTKAIDKIFKVKKDSNFTEEDFEMTVDKVTDEGVLEEEQAEIIQSALDFADTKVKEVLTPKDKMLALDIHGLTHEQLQKILINTKYSRIPIYDREFNNFIGVLHIKNYFKAIEERSNASIRKMLQKPYFISPNVTIDDLFNGFKRHHTHLALVRDRNKNVIGMVTMEDVLEELVSDISEPTALKGKRNNG
ncbi:MAG: hemolysin family protein [Bacilli bacterium]|nr:hemolysin family protein [Bacilli bacterium]